MKAILLSFALLFTGLIAAPVAQAIPCVLLTQTNGLITFDSASPGTASAVVPITGLGTFNLVGLDVRTTVQTVGPANPGVGTIWALGMDGTNARLFVINPATAAATPVSAVIPGIMGAGDNFWFFGHDPGTDRFRMITQANSYLFNPNNLTIVPQTSLTGFPALNGSGFETKSFGETSAIFFVEQTDDGLYTSTNIASGTFTSVGPLGISFSVGSGLDIDGATTLFASKVGASATLFSVNRATGAATAIGTINGNPDVRGLAIRPASFPPRLPVTLRVKGSKNFETPLPIVTIRGTAACKAGIKRVDFRVGATTRKAKGTRRWSARVPLKSGHNVAIFRATGNNLIKSKPVRVIIDRE